MSSGGCRLSKRSVARRPPPCRTCLKDECGGGTARLHGVRKGLLRGLHDGRILANEIRAVGGTYSLSDQQRGIDATHGSDLSDRRPSWPY